MPDVFDSLPQSPEQARVLVNDRVSIYDHLGFSDDVFAKRISSGYVIEDKATGAYLPWGPLLRSNTPQLRFVRFALAGMREGGPQRYIVLKGRKSGLSTAAELLLLELAIQLPWDVGVVAHTQESANTLFGIARTAYEHLPKVMRPEFQYMRANYIKFGTLSRERRRDGDFGHDSSFSCETAAGVYPFSGSTIRAMHLSEAAKYDSAGNINDQMRFIMSALQSLPKNGASVVIAESSANGQQGWFYETWQRASKGKSDWKPFFIGFLDDPSASLSAPSGYDWEDWPKDDLEKETMYRRKYGAVDSQLYFRRFTIVNELNGDPDLFDQEYPISPEMAFLASGRPAIPRHSLKAQEEYVLDPGARLSARLIEDSTPAVEASYAKS